MTLSSAINTARSGLQATSLRADLVATNIANANTPGYVRRTAILNENLLGGQSSGVLSDGVSRSRNEAITQQRRASASEVGHASVLSEHRTALSRVFGDTADGTGMASRLSDLDDSIRQATLTPESETGLQRVYSAARSVVEAFEDLSGLADRLYRTADSDITSTVSTINSTLAEIDTLNNKIAGVDRTTSGAAGLMDERDRALDRLSEFISIETVPREGGQIDVLTSEGVFLLQGEAIGINLSVTLEPDGSETMRLDVDGIEVTPGAESFSAISTGRLAALFTVRDTEIPGFAAQLAALGQDLGERFSTPGLDPTLAAGDTGLLAYTPAAGAPASPGTLQIDARADPAQGGALFRLRDGLGAVTSGPPGQGAILQGMSDALSSIRPIDQAGISGQFSAHEAASHLASLLGQARVSQGASLSASQAQLNALSEIELGESGVNIDDQMQQLLLIEQAYAANARVIQAVDTMIKRLLEF